MLARRGLPLREFVDEWYRDGRLPALRAVFNGSESFFYTDDEFNEFRRERATAGQEVIKTELSEARIPQECFQRLESHHCAVADLFLKREEQVTGDLSPAVFVMIHGGDDPIELENLSGLLAGVRDIGARGWEIKPRFKGLGEMNKEELWETTMDPANRVLRKVSVGESAGDPEQDGIDAVEADRIFSILMGENVELRRRFIEENAINVRTLDV